MGETEKLKKQIEELERKEKAKKEVLDAMRKRNIERAQLKKKLWALKHKKTSKVLKGISKTGSVAGKVLGELGNQMTQSSQQPKRVVRRTSRVSRARRKPVKRQISDIDFYMNM